MTQGCGSGWDCEGRQENQSNKIEETSTTTIQDQGPEYSKNEPHGQQEDCRASLQDSSSAPILQGSVERQQAEPSEKEELADIIVKAKQEISDLRTQWEARGKAWTDTRKELLKAFETKEKDWQHKISQLEELVEKKDEHIRRREEDQGKRAALHSDTLTLVSSMEAALKEQQQECARLQEQCSMKLASQELRHQAELQKREAKAQQELSDLQMKWEAKEEAWGEARRLLEQKLQTREDTWQKELRHVQELAAEQRQHACRVEEERAAESVAHMETVALLSSAKAALQQWEEECAGLKDQHSVKLAEQQQIHQEELSKKEKSFQNELATKVMEAKQELAGLQTRWEAKEEAWGETRRSLEETLEEQKKISEEKEPANMEEIQLLNDRILQLQVSCLQLCCVCL